MKPQLFDLSQSILFENEDILVINKPPFVSSLDERDDARNSVLRVAKQHYSDAQVCHRLDKETSGALIIAKNPTAYRHIAMQFEHREVQKEYHAVIQGTHEFTELEVNLPILNLGKGNVAISKQEGKTAQTIFNSIKYYRHFTLVACKPVTGRMHQIRIHLASQRAVIAGDEMYGGELVYLSQIKRKYHIGKDQEEHPIMNRFALHAYRVSFALLSGEVQTVEAPYPKDFAVLLKMLDKFDS